MELWTKQTGYPVVSVSLGVGLLFPNRFDERVVLLGRPISECSEPHHTEAVARAVLFKRGATVRSRQLPVENTNHRRHKIIVSERLQEDIAREAQR